MMNFVEGFIVDGMRQVDLVDGRPNRRGQWLNPDALIVHDQSVPEARGECGMCDYRVSAALVFRVRSTTLKGAVYV